MPDIQIQELSDIEHRYSQNTPESLFFNIFLNMLFFFFILQVSNCILLVFFFKNKKWII